MTSALEGSLHERLRFHAIDRTTGETLRAQKARIMAALPEILDGFYRHVMAFPDTAAFFKDEAHRQHAMRMQIRHWDLITEGTFDDRYAKSVIEIGEVHNRIGLSPRYYIGGYSFLVCGLIEAVRKAEGHPLVGRAAAAEATSRIQSALARAVMLDMDLALSVYIAAGKRERQEGMERLARTFESSIGPLVVRLGDSASGLTGTARTMADAATGVTDLAHRATESSAAVATNVGTVAAASEELSASIAEIGRQADSAATLSRQAQGDAERSSDRIRRLSDAADEIGKVVDLIDSIAAQTNLLALNATIEAARAGEAGKGFAVVAAEVKQLADQTAKATKTIADQIAAIQSTTADSVTEVAGISRSIGELSRVSAAIAAAVEEQSAATLEITRNVQAVAAGTGSVGASIGGVTAAAADSSDTARKVTKIARDLGDMAGELRHDVDGFLATVRRESR